MSLQSGERSTRHPCLPEMSSKDGPAAEQNIWMQLLEEASNDKRLAEKNLVVLGA